MSVSISSRNDCPKRLDKKRVPLNSPRSPCNDFLDGFRSAKRNSSRDHVNCWLPHFVPAFASTVVGTTISDRPTVTHDARRDSSGVHLPEFRGVMRILSERADVRYGAVGPRCSLETSIRSATKLAEEEEENAALDARFGPKQWPCSHGSCSHEDKNSEPYGSRGCHWRTLQ